MERPKCKLCSRTFANGRALGGHMKAHLATLPLPPKPVSSAFSSAAQSSSSSHPASSSRDDGDRESRDDKAAAIYQLRENPRRSLKFSDPELSSPNEEAAAGLDGEESEAESTRRRSKRGHRELSLSAGEDEEAAIAMCLVMLSRDKWRTTATKNTDVKRHRCEVCNKAFRSSQALGGHRVTHRKAMNVKEEAAAAERYRKRFVDNDGEDEKIFECPYCFKVFGSGQALGGHKRSHVIGSGNGSAVSSSKARSHKQSSLIDLNLPAPPEEEDDRSVVSDGEIAEPPGRT